MKKELLDEIKEIAKKHRFYDQCSTANSVSFITDKPTFCIEKFNNYFKRLGKVIIKNEPLSSDFIEHFKEDLDWEAVSRQQTFSEENMEKFEDYIDWDVVSCYQKLSKEFMEKHQSKLTASGLKSNLSIDPVNLPRKIAETKVFLYEDEKDREIKWNTTVRENMSLWVCNYEKKKINGK